MPTYEFGDMWSTLGKTDLFCITTNSMVRQDGRLVMGRGIAKQAIQRFPHLHMIAGSQITHGCGSGGRYGLIQVPGLYNSTRIGLYQVKYHWRDRADLALILHSARRLRHLMNIHTEWRVDLNFPGIGNGHLDVGSIKGILDETLSDKVHIWRFHKQA